MASWKPNNDGRLCGCELTVASGAVLGDKGTIHSFVSQCAEHAGMTANEVRDENLRASKVMNHLLANAPAAAVIETVESGRAVRRWADGHEPVRSFSAPGRIMNLRVSDAWTPQQRAAALAAVDGLVGAGKTRLV